MMQDYLLPNRQEISKEDIEMIFKLRCKVIHVKMNMKAMYKIFLCEICEKYEESQSHVYECDKIWEMRKLDKVKEPKYEMIENGNINEQLMIVKTFLKNFKILEKQRMVKNL